MGGYGSTRWGYHSRKTTVEECMRLDIADILPSARELAARKPGAKRSVLKGGNMVGYGVEYDDVPVLRLTYSGGRIGYVRMTATYPFNKVPRWWFQCPRCQRRCRCIYLPYGAYGFACRKCHDLSYDARQQTNASRHLEGLMPGLARLEKAEKLKHRMEKYKYWSKGKERLWEQYRDIVLGLSE